MGGYTGLAIMIHMRKMMPEKKLSQDRIQTYPIIRITKTLSRQVHGVVVL